MKAPKKILVVDDEVDVTELLSYHLKQKEYDVHTINDPRKALEAVRRWEPDLIILDVMMPELSGLQVCQLIRADSSIATMPILFLSARSEEGDRIDGFESGGDDYVCKPFSPKELILRVSAILKRSASANPSSVLEVHGIRMDVEQHKVEVGESPVDLTATEFRLLRLLLEQRGKVQTRETLLQKVWNYENDIETRTVDTHMRRLREKLGEEASWLETIRGVGYRLVESR